MFNLVENDIHLAAQADDKQQAITAVAQAFVEKGLVEEGYLQGMLTREQQNFNIFREWYCDSSRHTGYPSFGKTDRCTNLPIS